MTDEPTLTTTGPATGGGSVGRDEDGRAVFVDDALPGETVRVALTESHARFARGRIVELLDPAPGRVTPPCVEATRGCGGCDLMHATQATQLDMKRAVVRDTVARLGRVEPPELSTVELAATGYRTVVRVAFKDGRPSFRVPHSHELHPIDTCLVAHPLIDELLRDGRFGDAEEATLRVGARTGERMAVITGSLDGVRLPDDVVVAASDQPGSAAIHEEVAGRRFRISAGSFFQGRPDGADALIGSVGSAVGDLSGRTVVDLYAGVGLFSATVAAAADRVVAVESNQSAVADARRNLEGHRGRVSVLRMDVSRWRPSRADVVIADPSRAGLGKVGAQRVVAAKAPTVVLVSCDAGSLGRDVGLLAQAGYRLDALTLVDLFPHTHHVEVVSVLRR